MPGMTGLRVARELDARRPDVRVVMLSMHDNEQYFFEELKAGASGYVLKPGANRDLVDACRAAMRGSRSSTPPPSPRSSGTRSTGCGRARTCRTTC